MRCSSSVMFSPGNVLQDKSLIHEYIPSPSPPVWRPSPLLSLRSLGQLLSSRRRRCGNTCARTCAQENSATSQAWGVKFPDLAVCCRMPARRTRVKTWHRYLTLTSYGLGHLPITCEFHTCLSNLTDCFRRCNGTRPVCQLPSPLPMNGPARDEDAT